MIGEFSEYERVGAFISSLAQAEGDQPQNAEIGNVIAPHDPIGESVFLNTNPVARKLVDDLIANCQKRHQSAAPLSREAAQAMKLQCEELRMRLFAISLARGFGTSIPELRPLLLEDEIAVNGPLIREIGALSYAVLDDAAVILIPSIRNMSQCHELFYALATIFDETKNYRSWVFDFSLCEELPLIILGTLLSYHRQLRVGGRELLFCFLKPNLIPSDMDNNIVKRFDLIPVGGYWFSRKLQGN